MSDMLATNPACPNDVIPNATVMAATATCLHASMQHRGLSVATPEACVASAAITQANNFLLHILVGLESATIMLLSYLHTHTWKMPGCSSTTGMQSAR